MMDLSPHLFNGIIRSLLLSQKMDVTSVKKCRERMCGTECHANYKKSDERWETSVSLVDHGRVMKLAEHFV